MAAHSALRRPSEAAMSFFPSSDAPRRSHPLSPVQPARLALLSVSGVIARTMTTVPPSPVRATWLGFVVAALGPTAILLLFKRLTPAGPLTDGWVVARELALLALTGLLLVLVVRGERRNVESIGLHGRHWGRSLLHAIGLYLACMAAALVCAGLSRMLGFSEGVPFRLYQHVSPWALSLVMVRAGVMEEICYRGFLMARLEEIGRHWLFSLVLPALYFGLLHYTQGPRGILIAFGVGLVLGASFRFTRDLKANIIAHFLVDFIANVLPRLLH